MTARFSYITAAPHQVLGYITAGTKSMRRSVGLNKGRNTTNVELDNGNTNVSDRKCWLKSGSTTVTDSKCWDK